MLQEKQTELLKLAAETRKKGNKLFVFPIHELRCKLAVRFRGLTYTSIKSHRDCPENDTSKSK